MKPREHEVVLKVRYIKDGRGNIFILGDMCVDGNYRRTISAGDLAWLLMQAYHHVVSDGEDDE